MVARGAEEIRISARDFGAGPATLFSMLLHAPSEDPRSQLLSRAATESQDEARHLRIYPAREIDRGMLHTSLAPGGEAREVGSREKPEEGDLVILSQGHASLQVRRPV